MPKSYAAEFRRRAVALARSGRPVGQLAVDLKVSEAILFLGLPKIKSIGESVPGCRPSSE